MADVVTMLLEDHDTVRSLLAELPGAEGARRVELRDQLVHVLAVHETAEEEVVWPAVRGDVQGGGALADARISEEKAAQEVLKRLDDMDPGADDFEQALSAVKNAVEDHARHEEEQVFPKLREAESPERLEAMGALVAAAKAVAPTHPHPKVPGTATANVVAGPAAAVVDRARDAIREAKKRLG